MLIQYARRYFTGFLAQPRSTSIPPITEAQAEALDALHFLAEEHSASLEFQKGDVQYVNNLSIFHARDGYRDELGKEYVFAYASVYLCFLLIFVDAISFDFGCEIQKILGILLNPFSIGGTLCIKMFLRRNKISLWSPLFGRTWAPEIWMIDVLSMTNLTRSMNRGGKLSWLSCYRLCSSHEQVDTSLRHTAQMGR